VGRLPGAGDSHVTVLSSEYWSQGFGTREKWPTCACEN
jgi:hypothetical protein